MRRFGPLPVLLLLVLPLAVASACAGPQAQGPDIVIGAVYPTTGPQGAGGAEELAGLRAALAVAQQDGLVNASRVRLVVEDAQTPDGAARAVDRLIDRDGARIIAGTYGSTLAQAAAARADARHVVFWETGAVADPVTAGRRWVFRTVATGGNLGQEAVDFTGQVLQPRYRDRPQTAVVVSVDDVYGRSVGDGEQAAAARYGIQVIDRVTYDPHAFDVAAVAARVAAAHASYLWDVSYIDDGVAIWKAIRDSGTPLLAAVGTSSAFCMDAFGQRLGADAVGVYAADKPDATVNPAALSPAARDLLARARAAYARTRGGSMTIPAVAGFVGGWALFHDVLPRAGSEVTSESVRVAATGVDVAVGDAINGGGVRFAPEGAYDAGQNLRAAAVVGQWQAVETMRVVYPATYATASPIFGLR